MTDELTEFNSNVATLKRVNSWLERASVAAYNNDYSGWLKCVNEIMKEAIVKMKPAMKEKCLADLYSLEKNVSLFLNAKYKNNLLFTELKRELNEYEIFLRQFMNDKGMLLKDDGDEGL